MEQRLRRRAVRSGAIAVVLGLALVGCGDDNGSDGSSATTPGTTTTTKPVIDPGDGGNYQPELDPSTFTATIDNPYLPLTPGSRWVYEGGPKDAPERTVVVVTDQRRTIMGIEAVVVRDTVSVGGTVIEDTYDWYAQDADGNVWYLGEDTREFEDGKVVTTEGSWEAGVDGALPGIAFPAHPTVGQAYRQEYLAGQAEDMGEVLRVDEAVTIGLGTYDGVVVTEDWTPIEPKVVEEKSYAPGVGVVLEVTTAGPDKGDREELVSFTPG